MKRRATSPATRSKRAPRLSERRASAIVHALERTATALEAWVTNMRAEAAKMDARVLKIDKERDEERARQQAAIDDQARHFGTMPRAPHPKSPPHGHRFPPEFFAGRRFCIVCDMEDRPVEPIDVDAEVTPTPPRSPLRSV